MSDKNYVAVDLGAESGRVMLGKVTPEKVVLEQVHRFSNGPVEQDGSLRWDFEYLVNEIEKGIGQAARQVDDIVSIGVDTWGVDFGLLDKKGNLLENPYNYRDKRTDGMPDEVFNVMNSEGIYRNTGIQLMQINSLYQLLACRRDNPDVFGKADKLLFMPDLVVYYLTGQIQAEYTIASTSQMVDMKTGRWSREVLEAFDIPIEILPEIVRPGATVGKLKEEVARRAGCEQIPVVTVGSHDTASAVAGVPAKVGKKWGFLSSGTWSLMGMEIDKAIVNEKSYEHQFTNEGGVEGKIRLLKNLTGLWLVQECRRYWAQEGQEFDYAELTKMAEKAWPFKAVLDVDHKPFMAMGDMPEKINAYLESTGQGRIEDKGQMVRVILESLAVRYANVLEMLEDMSGQKLDVLHIVGGGIKNSILNQFTADATGKEVVTGPVEATAAGNVLVQAIASGQIKSLSEGRGIIEYSVGIERYQPQNRDEWGKYISR